MTLNDMESITQVAARRGADFLDTTYPEWVSRVDESTLELGSCSRCLWGQLCGNFGFAWEYLEAEVEGAEVYEWTIQHGFEIDIMEIYPNDHSFEYHLLTEAWRKEIRTRKIGTATGGE